MPIAPQSILQRLLFGWTEPRRRLSALLGNRPPVPKPAEDLEFLAHCGPSGIGGISMTRYDLLRSRRSGMVWVRCAGGIANEEFWFGALDPRDAELRQVLQSLPWWCRKARRVGEGDSVSIP